MKRSECHRNADGEARAGSAALSLRYSGASFAARTRRRNLMVQERAQRRELKFLHPKPRSRGRLSRTESAINRGNGTTLAKPSCFADRTVLMQNASPQSPSDAADRFTVFEEKPALGEGMSFEELDR